jgi:Antibiotic biosynthesis monooxygenase.
MKAKEKPTLVIIWEFRVAAGKRREFESAYGPDGEWARFFGRARNNGYVETQLIRDAAVPTRYLTLDFWTSPQAYERFKKENQAEYQAIDQRCESLTQRENEIGRFQCVVGSDRNVRSTK